MSLSVNHLHFVSCIFEVNKTILFTDQISNSVFDEDDAKEEINFNGIIEMNIYFLQEKCPFDSDL